MDLGLIVSAVKEDFERKIKECNGTIHVGNLPTLEGNHSQLQVLFQNMISNSLKYHQHDVAPVVNLTSSYSKETETWSIEVADNGIRIEEKYFERIFKPFERLHGRNAYEGTGIGLAICKKSSSAIMGRSKYQACPKKEPHLKYSFPKNNPLFQHETLHVFYL